MENLEVHDPSYYFEPLPDIRTLEIVEKDDDD